MSEGTISNTGLYVKRDPMSKGAMNKVVGRGYV